MLSMGLVLLLAGPAAAQLSGDASARVDPSTVHAGDDLDLVLSITSPDLAEVSLQEEITCTVTLPSGEERAPCERQGSLVSVRLVGEETREHVFAYQAPGETGSYEVRFNATNTLSVPPTSYQAETSFEVVPAEDLQPGSEDGASGDETGDSGTADDGASGNETADDGTAGDDDAGDGGPPADEGEDEPLGSTADDGDEPRSEFGTDSGNGDEARVFVSTAASIAVLAGAIVANRWPIGG